MSILTLESKLKTTKYGKKAVSELAESKETIIRMVKDGYEFDDEVFAKAHIKRIVRDVRVFSTLREKVASDMKVYPKDTASVKQIVSELNTIENDKKLMAKEDDEKTDDAQENFYVDEGEGEEN